ncbi:HAD family hydrolase [Terribacillus saccharophilus]|uniref:HAD family hydrolase n=1 Tax=Terribacillus saccharophilus TaxID=361277 RepID=A0A268H8Z4_9BACI|nr:HAD family hydrolase [Terribacillus saccharophilus]PAE06352.1 HAD family hydrolase [Terribacillus saccharophilus]
MTKQYNQVKEFHKAFDLLHNDNPTPMSKEIALKRAVWSGEELIEFLYATVGGNISVFEKLYEQFMAGLDNAKSKIREEQKPVEDILVAQADALIDEAYFNNGSFTILGVKPEPLFDIVHEANMGKLHNGIAKYRESDGKIIKPENWERDFAPEKRLKVEIDRQAST